jgi:signal transduction histidine kinase
MDSADEVYSRRADFGARILVVDDDALTRRSMRAILERARYKVESAGGGAEAIEAIPAWRPELVLLDILMPGIDGIETCRRIRAMAGGELIPIIFLTGDGRAETHSGAFQAAGDDFLRKPVSPTELIFRIRSLMRLKRLQAQIQAERDALIELQDQNKQLFEFIVHDLKNPLMSIQLGLDLLRDGKDHAPATQLRLWRIRETAQSMGRMIQDILDIGRAEQIGLPLHLSQVSVRDWIPGLLGELENRAQLMNQTVAWECAEDLILSVDRELLGRMIMNLMDNAMKYSPSGSQTRIEVEALDRRVYLRVRDQGNGVPDHLREEIFNKFKRLEGEGATTRTSSGLGLTFCKVVAEAHGGRIWVEPNQPRGSVFIVELPALDLAGLRA